MAQVYTEKWKFYDAVEIPHMFYNGPAWVRQLPDLRGHYQGPLIAMVGTCEMDMKTRKFTIPCKPREYLWAVVGTDNGGNKHVIQAERFHDLSTAKREATLALQAQTGNYPKRKTTGI